MNAKSARVLLVDDEESVREVCREVLEMHGFSVASCSRAQDALELLRKGDVFDVVLSDFKMPLMNGLKLLGELRQAACTAPFILLTGEMESQTSDGPKPDLILYKPVRIDDMVSSINKLMGK